MSSSHLQFTARIEGPPGTIFNLIADLPNYGRWLPGSDGFGRDHAGVALSGPSRHNLSRRGTGGQKPGSVTGYDPPNYIAFHHTMRLKKGPLTAAASRLVYFAPEFAVWRPACVPCWLQCSP